LIFFFNIERIVSPFNVRSYTYVFVAVVAAITLILPRLQRIPFLILLALPIPVFLGYKAFMEKGDWHDNLLAGSMLPFTVTQLSAIILTGLLARQIQLGLQEFEGVIAAITFGHIGKLPKPFSEGQDAMYKEVKRARRYQRPLTVIALKIDDESIQIALPQIIENVQRAMMKEYILASVARTLDENMHDFDTIALRDNHFILMLPELPAEETPLITQRLEKLIKEKMNIRLQVGAASFPNDGVTFESLIELAVENARQRTGAPSELKPVYPAHHNSKTLILPHKEKS